jgi:hypothetical protein
MKKLLFYLIISCVVLIADFDSSFAQATFNTGTIGVNINTYGRFRIYTPDANGTIQVQRLSLLVGMDQTSVFDYTNDAENEEPTTLVSNPQLSDFEITGAFNNTYSNLPPNVLERMNVYGWTNGSYAILKFTVKNREADAFPALIGIESIPQPDGAYGYDTVSYDAVNNVIRSHRGIENIGFKLLSHPLTSLTSFEWYSGYSVDTDYWTWMNHGSIDPEYVSNTADGPVFITAQDPININPQDSVFVYYAVAVGADETEMLASMAEAEQKYLQIVPVELTSFTAKVNPGTVKLKWTTASEINNHGFEVERMSNGNWITIGFKEGAGTTTEQKSYTFNDNIISLNAKQLCYRLKQIDFNGESKYSNIVEVAILPVKFNLSQNYPNPFNPSTMISFTIPHRENVTLDVYNLLGQKVTSIINREMDGGNYDIRYDASSLSAGIYFYTLKAGSYVSTKKMMLIK